MKVKRKRKSWTSLNFHVLRVPFIHYLYVIYARKFYVRSHGKITRQSQPLTQYNNQKQRIKWIETEDIELNNYMCIFPLSGEVRARDSSLYVLV